MGVRFDLGLWSVVAEALLNVAFPSQRREVCFHTFTFLRVRCEEKALFSRAPLSQFAESQTVQMPLSLEGNTRHTPPSEYETVFTPV